MACIFPTWLSTASEAIRRFAVERPLALFALLLAMNAVARPCSSTAHDARLYSLQALNQAEHGAYANDIFLIYGSQDQFSLFSRLVGPLVATFGLRLTFFAHYLVFNTLFLFALFRFVRSLLNDAAVSTLALIFLTTAPLTYGGYDIFMVHEQFFTPRIIGTTLTLFALERLLHQRFASAFLLLLLGSLVHPLMAFGGVLIWLGVAALSWLPVRISLGLFLAAVIGGGVILAVPVFGERLFGTMDEEWHQMIRLAVGYNYPDDWMLKDWLQLGVSFAVPIAAVLWLFRDDPVRRRFLVVATAAAAVGLTTTVIASRSPYALLFQGQPYRVVWILKVLQVPLGFLLVVCCSQSNAAAARSAALLLLAYFCISHYTAQEFAIFALMTIISIGFSKLAGSVRETNNAADTSGLRLDARQESANGERRGVSPTCLPQDTPTLWYSLARGLVLGALGWTAFRCWFFFTNRAVIAERYDLDEWVLCGVISPIVWLVAFGLAAVRHGALSQHAQWLAGTCAAVALVTPTALFAMEISPSFREEHTRFGSDITFVQQFVREHQHGVPAIYCSLGRPDLIWIDVKATSYYDLLQTAGVMFNRRTAEEIKRRIALVNKFELQRHRQEGPFLSDVDKIAVENLLRLKFDAPAPTQSDLARLCCEPGLDLVVVPQEFPGLYSASNGRIFVYECRTVRSRLALGETGAGKYAASVKRSIIP